jgi:hypothetical protein
VGLVRQAESPDRVSAGLAKLSWQPPETLKMSLQTRENPCHAGDCPIHGGYFSVRCTGSNG